MLRVSRDVCDSGYELGWEPFLPAPPPDPRRRPPSSATPVPATLCRFVRFSRLNLYFFYSPPVPAASRSQPSAGPMPPSVLCPPSSVFLPSHRSLPVALKKATPPPDARTAGVPVRGGCGSDRKRCRNCGGMPLNGMTVRRPFRDVPSAASGAFSVSRSQPVAEERQPSGRPAHVLSRAFTGNMATGMPEPCRAEGRGTDAR